MGKHVIVAQLKGPVILQSQLTLLDVHIGKVNILIEVVNDHADEVLSFNQILSKVLSGSPSTPIARLVHLLDQFQSNFEILQRKLLA